MDKRIAKRDQNVKDWTRRKESTLSIMQAKIDKEKALQPEREHTRQPQRQVQKQDLGR